MMMMLNKKLVGMAILVILLFVVIYAGYGQSQVSLKSFQKSDYLVKVKTEVDLDYGCTYYDSNFLRTGKLTDISSINKEMSWTNEKYRVGEGYWQVKEYYLYPAIEYVTAESCENETVEQPDNKTNKTVNVTVEVCINETRLKDENYINRTRWVDYNWDSKLVTELRYCARLKPMTGLRQVDHVPTIGNYTFNEYDWWNSNWLYCRNVTMDSSSATANLTNFPVYLYLEKANYSSAQSDWDDIRIVNKPCNQGGSTVPYEIENKTTDDARIHFKVSEYSNESDTVYSVYYGNSGATNGEDMEGTWNDDYMMVIHSSEQSGNLSDSTDQRNLTKKNSTNPSPSSDGMVANSHSYELDSIDYVMHPNFLDTNWPAAFTLELSFKPSGGYSAGEGYQYLWYKENVAGQDRMGATLRDDNGKMWVFKESGNDQDNTYSAQTSWSETWTYLVITVGTDGFKFYINGTKEADDDADVDVPGDGTNKDFIVGSLDSTTFPFDGNIDEIRVSNVTRDQNYVTMTYLSMTNQIITVSGEELGNTAPSITYAYLNGSSINITTENITLYLKVSDDSDTEIGCDISWLNNTENSTDLYVFNQSVTNGTLEIAILDSGNTTSKGENWIANVYCRDSSGSTVSLNSTNLTIEGNPSVWISYPQNVSYNSQTDIELNVSSDETIGTWYYSLNGGANVSFTPNSTFNTTETVNTIIVYGNDSINLWGYDAQYFVADITDPVITEVYFDSSCIENLTNSIIYWSQSDNHLLNRSRVVFTSPGSINYTYFRSRGSTENVQHHFNETGTNWTVSIFVNDSANNIGVYSITFDVVESCGSGETTGGGGGGTVTIPEADVSGTDVVFPGEGETLSGRIGESAIEYRDKFLGTLDSDFVWKGFKFWYVFALLGSVIILYLFFGDKTRRKKK